MSIQNHKNLEVWQRAMKLVTEVYRLTKDFPKEELYGLCSQMRRAAVSIPSNIAEGRAKKSTRDYLRFINIAYGSIAELETQLLIAQNLDYLGAEKIVIAMNECTEIGKMLNGLVASLEKKLLSSCPLPPAA